MNSVGVSWTRPSVLEPFCNMSWFILLPMSCWSMLACVVKVANKQQNTAMLRVFLFSPAPPPVCGALTHPGKHWSRRPSGSQQRVRGRRPWAARLRGSREPLFQVCRWKTEDAHAEEGGAAAESSQVRLPVPCLLRLTLLCSGLHETVKLPFRYLWHSHKISAFWSIDHEAALLPSVYSAW